MSIEVVNFLKEVKNREDFRNWFFENVEKESQCFVEVKMGIPEDKVLSYIDAVEEAICFGWIDSTTKKDLEGRLLQRFSPRRKNSNWTELNKERARRLIKLGKMTKYGENVLPNLDEKFVVDKDILLIFNKDKDFLKAVKNIPELYFKIRVDNIKKVKKNKELFLKRIKKFIEETKKGKLFGQWNDFGRLL